MISLILGASVVYFVNTALVSVVLTLVERGSIAEVWKHWCLGSLPYYIVGAMIVAATINAQNRVSTVAAVLIAPSILLTTMYYRFWLRPPVEQPIQSQEMSHGS
jgi:surface polysaccharide O-acyltransferase-like enzyme